MGAPGLQPTKKKLSEGSAPNIMQILMQNIFRPQEKMFP